MKKEIDPAATKRAQAFELWMQSPMPMVTFMKTFDVTRVFKNSRRIGIKFNVSLCWSIGKAASGIEEFYMCPEHGRLMQADRLGINVIVTNSKGGISSCDIPYSDDIRQFNSDYLKLTEQTYIDCQDITLNDCVIIGTSAILQTEIDTIVNQFSGIYCNPFLAWGRYHRHFWGKMTLPVSFQFHHAQMDGNVAATFLNTLQKVFSDNPLC